MVDLVRYLRERGVPADWAAEIERNVPESLRGMIERKLERLDDQERQLLRVAAVQGFQFDSAIVAQVLERDPADVEDALQSLDRVHGLVQLLREQELPSRLFSLRYQFVHVLYQNALHASVSPSRKASWSGKVAGALEAGHGERKSIVAAELALLYEMARDPWRASEHFLAAAEVASSRFATREAVAFAKRGLACLATAGDSAEARDASWRCRRRCSSRSVSSRATERQPPSACRSASSSSRNSWRITARCSPPSTAPSSSTWFAVNAWTAARISDRMLTVAGHSGSDVQQMNARMWAMIARHHLGDLLIAQRARRRLYSAGNAVQPGCAPDHHLRSGGGDPCRVEPKPLDDG